MLDAEVPETVFQPVIGGLIRRLLTPALLGAPPVYVVLRLRHAVRGIRLLVVVLASPGVTVDPQLPTGDEATI